jgi:hypothetical protein
MLVTFTCSAYADITMFGDVAKRLIKMMGLSGDIPGALTPEDIPQALSRLESSLAKIDEPAITPEDAEGEPVVTLHHRAQPLIDLLKAAERDDVDVMWREGT